MCQGRILWLSGNCSDVVCAACCFVSSSEPQQSVSESASDLMACFRVRVLSFSELFVQGRKLAAVVFEKDK